MMHDFDIECHFSQDCAEDGVLVAALGLIRKTGRMYFITWMMNRHFGKTVIGS
jgi:hypothetical protein